MKIRKVLIENFRGIKKLELDLDDVTVLKAASRRPFFSYAHITPIRVDWQPWVPSALALKCFWKCPET